MGLSCHSTRSRNQFGLEFGRGRDGGVDEKTIFVLDFHLPCVLDLPLLIWCPLSGSSPRPPSLFLH